MNKWKLAAAGWRVFWRAFLRGLRWNLWWRGPVHGVICWYLRRCGTAFHHGEYGPDGRYVALMTEDQYSRYNRVRGGWPAQRD